MIQQFIYLLKDTCKTKLLLMVRNNKLTIKQLEDTDLNQYETMEKETVFFILFFLEKNLWKQDENIVNSLSKFIIFCYNFLKYALNQAIYI